MTVDLAQHATPHRLLQSVTLSIGAAVAALGLLVMLAWQLHNFTILRVQPDYVPMQFNTALCFVLCGLGLILAASNRLQTSALLVSVAGLFGLLTLFEHGFGWDLGIDQMFFHSYIIPKVDLPGRFAPSTAFCLVLLTIAIWCAVPRRTSRLSALTGLLGSLIGGFGIIGVLGYLTDLPVTFVWGNFSSMAIHTASAFVLLGIGLVTLTLQNELQDSAQKGAGAWLAGALAITTFTIFLGATQSMLANEQSAIQAKTDVVVRATSNQLRTIIGLQMQSIDRMASRAALHDPTQLEWEDDARNYMHHSNHAYLAIQWLDTAYRTRWTVTTEPDRRHLYGNGERNTLRFSERGGREIRLLEAIDGSTGATRYLILAPIYRQNQLKGTILAVLNPTTLFQSIEIAAEQSYGIAAYNGTELLFANRNLASADQKWLQSSRDRVGDVSWQIKVWPILHQFSPSPWFVLMSGLLSAVALAFVVRKSRQARIRSRELFTIIDTAPVGMLVLDEQGRITQINRKGEALFGYTRQQTHDMQVWTLMPDLSLSDKGLTPITPHCLHRDGQPVFVEVGINRVQINAQEYILLVLTDISLRKEAERQLDASSQDLMRSHLELQQLQHLLQTTLDNVPALVGSWDMNLCNRFGNRAYSDWFGITPEQMRNRPMQEIIGQERFELLKPKLLSVLAGNDEVFERTIRYPDGQLRHVVISYVPDLHGGVVRGFFGFINDITLLKKTQISNEKILQQLQSIFNTARDFAIIETDTAGRITLFSRGAELLLGYTAQEVVGRAAIALDKSLVRQADDLAENLAELGAEPGAESGAELASENLAEHPAEQPIDLILQLGWQPDKGDHAEQSRSYDTTYLNRDGSSVPVNLTIAPVQAADGEVTGYLGIAKDIRNEQEILHALAEARDRAESASLAKSQFLANMSHEIRTPMNAILGMLQLLQHSELSAHQLDYASKIQTAAQALLGLLNDILDFSKIEANKVTLEQRPFRLDSLMRDLSVIYSSNIGAKNIDLLFDLDPNLPTWVIGDEMRLRQIMINLAGNAIKFTNDGAVVVAIKVIARNGLSTRITFSVKDTGIGIDAAHLSYIFEGFNQAEASTTRRFGGTGLGLAICQRLVELMGGELQVESALEQGSIFHFTLELMTEPNQMPGELAEFIARPDHRNHRVLIVDDNADAREILQTTVQSLGWQSQVAASGSMAITLLSQELPDNPFDIVFMDWKMPGMDGLQTALRIRAQRHLSKNPLIIIMVTAHDREVLNKRLGEHRKALDGFLIKPVTASMIVDAVTDATQQPVQTVMRQWQKRLSGLRLLVVEDNLFNMQVISEFLSGEGALVDNADNGRAGVEQLFNSEVQYHAVLMDIQMPVMDGFEATRMIREDSRLENLPIIALTANAMTSDREACRAAGMNDHVAKPIDLDNLVQTILRYCTVPKTTELPTLPDSSQPMQSDSIMDHSSNRLQDTGYENPVEPEFEFDAAVKRLGGSVKLFVKLVDRFEKDVSTMLDDTITQLVDLDYLKAAMTMHTLKGIAGTLGATALARRAAELEKELKQHTLVEDPGSTVGYLRHLLERSAVALRAYTTQTLAQPAIVKNSLDVAVSTPNTSAVPANDPASATAQRSANTGSHSAGSDTVQMNTDTVHTASLATLLKEFDQLLLESNMQATRNFEVLQDRLKSHYPDQISALSESMQKLNFKQALRLSKQLQDRLR